MREPLIATEVPVISYSMQIAFAGTEAYAINVFLVRADDSRGGAEHLRGGEVERSRRFQQTGHDHWGRRSRGDRRTAIDPCIQEPQRACQQTGSPAELPRAS